MPAHMHTAAHTHTTLANSHQVMCGPHTSLSATCTVRHLHPQEDVHMVFAPGKIFYIKRLDKHMGRAKYGNTVHKCALCESDDVIPAPDHHHEGCQSAADVAASSAPAREKAESATAAAAAAASSSSASDTNAADQTTKEEEKEFYPGAKFELIEAEPQQRFQRIVLRETCLLDHLTGGYIQGLKYALQQAKQKSQK